MRILVVEDDRATRLLLTRTLVGWGYEVISATDGEEAWKILERDTVRLLLTDWEMPRLAGPDLCRRLRAGNREYVYALLLTTHADAARLVEGLEAGADDFLSKPFNPGELGARLGVGRRLLGLQDDLAAKYAELQRANEQLSRIASTDPLMNVGNRRSFEEAVARVSERAARTGRSWGILMIDVDHFKRINDRYGHATGDRVLAAVATALVGTKGAADEVFRYGGEEVVVIAPDQEGPQLRTLGESLRGAVAALRFELSDGATIGVTVSVGAAAARPDESWDRVAERADQALYRAKETGRNRVEVG
jgi:two-component system, cell cycle response regulator